MSKNFKIFITLGVVIVIGVGALSFYFVSVATSGEKTEQVAEPKTNKNDVKEATPEDAVKKQLEAVREFRRQAPQLSEEERRSHLEQAKESLMRTNEELANLKDESKRWNLEEKRKLLEAFIAQEEAK